MFKKLFVIHVLLAAFLIQITGMQEWHYISNRHHLYGDLIYGYPQPFLATDAFDEFDLSYWFEIPGMWVSDDRYWPPRHSDEDEVGPSSH